MIPRKSFIEKKFRENQIFQENQSKDNHTEKYWILSIVVAYDNRQLSEDLKFKIWIDGRKTTGSRHINILPIFNWGKKIKHFQVKLFWENQCNCDGFYSQLNIESFLIIWFDGMNKNNWKRYVYYLSSERKWMKRKGWNKSKSWKIFAYEY